MSEVCSIPEVFEDYLQPARFKVAHGGRGSGKTRTFITILLNNVIFYRWKLICFREYMKSIKESCYAEIVEEIDRRGLHHLVTINKTEIIAKSGGRICFDFLRLNVENIKGYANFDAALVEEAENVSRESWNTLIPTVRKEFYSPEYGRVIESEIWVAYNPKNPLSDTHQRFVVDRIYPDFDENGNRYCIVKQINYTDNPWFPATLRRDMELMKKENFELYRHVYLGEPVADSVLAIIKPVWIEAAMDAHLDPRFKAHTGNLYGGLDVADEGADLNAVCYRDGQVVTHIREWKDADPVAVGERCYHEAAGLNADIIRYDNIGVGAGVKGKVRELDAQYFREGKKPIRFQAFTASEAPANPKQNYQPNRTNEAHFLNRKAQAWQLLADRFENTYRLLKEGKSVDMEKLISIETMTLDKKLLLKLQGELSAPRREFSNGKMKVESKDSLKKRGIPSPNLADALVMAFFEEDDALARLIKMG